MIEVELPDGRIVEFPDGTSRDVMRTALAKLTATTPAPSEAPQAEKPGLLGQIGEVARSGAAGVARGVGGLMDLPGAVMGLGADAASAGLNAIGANPDFVAGVRGGLEETPFGGGSRFGEAISTATGGASDYRSDTPAGQYAGTIGEFIPGALAGPGGVARNLALGATAGAASETAGRAAETLGAGETGQEIARVAGAFFGPVAFSTANKTVNTMFKRSTQSPTLDTLRQTKNAAYNAVDDAGVTFSPQQSAALSDRVKTVLADSDFVPDVDAQTRAALKIIERNAGQPLKLGQLDKIRQGLWKRYNAAPNEVAILDMIDEIDTAINSMPAATPLMQAARVANSRYKKAEVIENAFQKAQDQTASTGSGGNILNKYRQAVTRIINNPKQARFFSDDEIAYMREFVNGNAGENALRLVGKLSPSGNGLMMALNLGAAAYNPAMLAATAAGAGAKAVSDGMAMRGAGRVRDALATGQIPARQTGTLGSDAARVIPGLLAQ